MASFTTAIRGNSPDQCNTDNLFVWAGIKPGGSSQSYLLEGKRGIFDKGRPPMRVESQTQSSAHAWYLSMPLKEQKTQTPYGMYVYQVPHILIINLAARL